MRKIVIVRGTNPQLLFRSPRILQYDSSVTMTITQKGKEIITRECRVSEDGKHIAADLTAEETLRLRGGRCAEIQFRYNIGEEIYISPIATAEIGEQIGS